MTRLTSLAAGFDCLLAIVGEVARIVFLALASAALRGNLALLVFVHGGEPAIACISRISLIVVVCHTVLIYVC